MSFKLAETSDWGLGGGGQEVPSTGSSPGLSTSTHHNWVKVAIANNPQLVVHSVCLCTWQFAAASSQKVLVCVSCHKVIAFHTVFSYPVVPINLIFELSKISSLLSKTRNIPNTWDCEWGRLERIIVSTINWIPTGWNTRTSCYYTICNILLRWSIWYLMKSYNSISYCVF